MRKFWTCGFRGALLPGIVYLSLFMPASAIEAPTSDARLNSVFQKLMDNVRTNTEAVNHLRDAQRRWIAFRDAECELEAFGISDGSKHLAVMSDCTKRMTTQRADELAGMLSCDKGAFACVKAVANGKADTEHPSTAQQSNNSLTGVPFESPDLIEDFKVSGIWFPGQIIPYVGLSGPADFVFSNVKTGQSFKTAVNDVALLDENFLEKNGGYDLDSLRIDALVDKLKAAGVIKISLSSEMRAKVVSCSSAKTIETSSQGDRCLQFGSAAVDIQSVGFDGQTTFIFRRAGVAQRGEDAYEVMSYDGSSLQRASSELPLSDLDQMSEINLSKEQITLKESNGACESAVTIYGKDPSQNSKFQIKERIEYSTDAKGICYISDYVITGSSSVEGSNLKLKSRRVAK